MGEKHEELGIPYNEVQEVLKKARETYGNNNQIMVCIEELNELACVLAKYPRYDDVDKATQELYDKVLDEVADVYTILEHVKAIFNISEEALWQRRGKKTARLNRWLSHSNSMIETTVDRAIDVVESPCHRCTRDRELRETYDSYCVHCLKAQATEGKAPYFTDEE